MRVGGRSLVIERSYREAAQRSRRGRTFDRQTAAAMYPILLA
jgi:hypothetical protein